MEKKNLKVTKVAYWTSTILLALFILPGIFFINSQMAKEGTMHLGLPEWFRYEVSIAQFIAGLILIIPKLPKKIKEWAYVGMGIVYLSSFIAHLNVDGLIFMSFTPLITFALLLISYLSFNKINN